MPLHRSVIAALAAIGSASLFLGCSDHSPQSPTQPARRAESVTLGDVRNLTEGETVALVATVRWSTGVTEVVSDGITWASDDPRIASVDQRGVVTAVAAGESRIRATVNSVTGTAAVRIFAGPRTHSGRVHESLPTEQNGIAGATVTGVDRAGNTQSVITDSGGRFTLRLVTGPAQITVAAPGFETTTTAAELADTELSLSLAPLLREVREAFESSHPNPPMLLEERTYRFAVHHAGELRATYTGGWDVASAWTQACIEARDANDRVLALTRGVYDGAPAPIRLDVVPAIYTVKFFRCHPFNALVINLVAFAGEVRHPS